MQDFKNLQVWQKSHALTLKVYRLTQGFPAEERFGLTSQLRRASVSVESNLAEGSSRGSDVDFRRFVQMALGSASEVECQLLLARDLGFLPAADHLVVEQEIQQIKRMLIRLLQKLTSQSSQPLVGPPERGDDDDLSAHDAKGGAGGEESAGSTGDWIGGLGRRSAALQAAVSPICNRQSVRGRVRGGV